MKIAMIGAGAMGGATVEGLLKARAVQPEMMTVADPTAEVLEKFQAKGLHTTTDNACAAKEADVVCVCVKPWLVADVLAGIKDSIRPKEQLLVVIAAGISPEQVKAALPDTPPFFLVIPNIAIAELASMTFMVPIGATDAQTACVKGLFERMGSTLLTDFQHLAAGTTLASCGIAYAMRYIRAASEGGVELGFKADVAKDIVMQTVQGAVKLLQTSGMHPEQAIDLVTTPGGVTIKGLNEMEHAGFTSAVIRGLKAGMK